MPIVILSPGLVLPGKGGQIHQSAICLLVMLGCGIMSAEEHGHYTMCNTSPLKRQPALMHNYTNVALMV